MQETIVPATLLLVLDGLVPLHIARFASRPAERDRALAEAGDLADTMAAISDRLAAAGNFPGTTARRERGRLLTTMATCLALGAEQDSGITWGGGHWCTRPHDGCPHRRAA